MTNIEINKDVGGHKNKILDVIMTPARELELSRIESIGAKGGKAITITFTDEWIFKYKEKYLYNLVETIMRKTKNVQEWVLKEEYSDTGRYHLHGVVLFRTLKSITNLRRKLSVFGISKVKTIDNSVKWAEYCMKGVV